MTVMLTKGGNVSLTKQTPGLKAIMGGPSGKVLSDAHFVFFDNLKSPDGSVEHTGDNLTGAGAGDDESLLVNLKTVPAECDRIVFPVSIHEAALHLRQTQGLLRPGPHQPSLVDTLPTDAVRVRGPQAGEADCDFP